MALKVRDLAYGRLQAPDLDAQEEFLTAFGMVRAARTPTALYMRGTDPIHHIHITEKGDPKCHGLRMVCGERGRIEGGGETARRIQHRDGR